MFNKTKRSLALFLTVAMVLAMFAGIAHAAPPTPALQVTSTATTIAPGDNWAIGVISVTPIDIIPPVGNDRILVPTTTLTEVTITLPEGVTFAANPAAGNVTTTPAGGIVGNARRGNANRSAMFDLTAAAAVEGMIFGGVLVNAADTFRGVVNATVTMRNIDAVTGVQNWIQTATVEVARVIGGGTISTALAKPSLQRGVAWQTAGNIRIEEGLPAQIGTAGVDNITITLPPGVQFAAVPTVVNTFNQGLSLAVAPFTFDATLRRLSIDVTTQSAVRGHILEIRNILLTVTPGVPDGDIIVEVRGSGVTSHDIAIASIGAPAVTITARQTDRFVNIGRINNSVSDVRMVESIEGVIQPNRSITLTLPVGFTWNAVPSVITSPVLLTLGAGMLSPDNRTVTYWTGANFSAAPTTVDFTALTVNARNNAPAAPLTVTVGGTAGIAGTVNVATVRKLYTVVAPTMPTLVNNARNQAISSIVITEAIPGALRPDAGYNLFVTMPVGVTINPAAVEDVKVTATVGRGNIVVDDFVVIPVDPATDRSEIWIDLGSPDFGLAGDRSTVVTAITISGIRVDTGHLTLQGNLEVQVSGEALTDTGLNVHLPLDFVAAGVVGAPVSPTARKSVFTIDATTFTVNGASRTMDVAPTIVAGRTMVPLRAAATSVGVTDDSIFFDKGVATFIRGDRVVQVTLGSTTMIVNGAPIPMDVAPMLVEGRILLPVRFIGVALGAKVDFNATARTVTVSVE